MSPTNQICIHLRETEQWTSQARDLYDLLILIFTDAQGALADLPKLQNTSKLPSADWDDLLQYTVQVFLEEPWISIQVLLKMYRVCIIRFSAIWSISRLSASPRSCPVFLLTSLKPSLPIVQTRPEHCLCGEPYVLQSLIETFLFKPTCV